MESASEHPTITPLLLNVAQVAALCDLCERSVWSFSESGHMPGPVKIGRSKKWRRADVLNWIEDGCPKQRRAR